jgi:hypothetical protein
MDKINVIAKYFAIFLILFSTSCTGRYTSLSNVMSQCGFKTAPYAEFHSCMDQKLPTPHKGEQDYYAKTATDIRSELQFYDDQIAADKIKQKDAYEGFAAYVHEKNLKEQQSSQVAGAIIAIGLVGVAANACYNTGSCGGSGYSNSHQGCCSWHNGISHCGGVHLVCHDGWVSGCPC